VDLSKLPIKPTKRSRPTAPEDIFKSLTLRGSVENMWGPQVEAVREWDAIRGESDVIIEMTTGGGKTLAGLLIGQSLVNETNGKILYVCSTKQLIEQTAARAQECSIPLATYFGGNWTGRNVFDGCTGLCITNYAAVFNGLSIFKKESLRGIIFDDAHVANNAIRGQFTIRIDREHAAFQPTANCFRDYFSRNNQQQFEEALQGFPLSLLFLPQFEMKRQAKMISKILLDNGVTETKETLFAWAHLKDHIGLCTLLLSGAGIEITPQVLPLFTLPYFAADIRRVYLTATLPSQVEFLRTFGVLKAKRVTPGGKSGEAQRLFVFTSGFDDEGQRTEVVSLTNKHKTCVICPSAPAAEAWPPPAIRFESAHGHAAIEAFSDSVEPQKLVLVARYDGIDLPGDACRVLVLDGLPVGSSLIDRFLDQGLKVERLRAAHTATRIVQAIGRIFRSNTDHGAVILCGDALQSWLRDPNNQRYMPTLLQQQIQFGIELRRMVDESKATFADLLKAVLSGRKDWDELYSNHVGAFDAVSQPEDPAWFSELVTGERDAYAKLWSRNFPLSASAYGLLADQAEKHDRRLAAWYRHWQGCAADWNGEDVQATRIFLAAANERVELGRPSAKGGTIISGESVTPGWQAKAIGKLFTANRGKVRARLQSMTADLKYGPETKKAEQALRELGHFLGLEASRPDNEKKTGPDVLWRCIGEKGGAALESKTNKQPNGQYHKVDDIGQFDDHIRYLERAYPGENHYKAIVGRKLPVSSNANPPNDLLVIPLEQFVELANRLGEMFEYVESAAHEGDVAVCVQKALVAFGLVWPQCLTALESYLAADLRNPRNLESADME
jgi:hypothetical protein